MITPSLRKIKAATEKSLICNLTIGQETHFLTMPKTPVKLKDNPANNHKSPLKERVTCQGCGKEFTLLLSHLERTKSCQKSYDMPTMRQEANALTKERKAQRSRDHYKEHSEEKKAAAKRLYEENPEKKKVAMTAYNEKHREDINLAMYDHYIDSWGKFECPICDKTFVLEKSRKSHIDHFHCVNQNPSVCQICDKTFEFEQSLQRHMKEVHQELVYVCQKCPAVFVRDSLLDKHDRESRHYLSFYCNVCKKNIIFKNFRGLLEHVIVKQSETNMEFPKGSKFEGQTFLQKKSGFLVTCKTRVESIQEEEGRYLKYCSKEEKEEAFKRRIKRKEEIINEGLKAANGPYRKPSVKVEFISTHEKDMHRQEEEAIGHCKYCLMKIPFNEDDESEERRERTLCQLLDWW